MLDDLPRSVHLAIGAFLGGGSAMLFMVKFFMPRKEIGQTIIAIKESIQRHLDKEEETNEKVHSIEVQMAGNRVEMEWIMSSLSSIMEKLGANGVPPPPRKLPPHK